jgi:hypothetical protein
MTRYFFDTQDGQSVADAEGVELPSLAAAEIEAVRLAGELLREHAEEFWTSRVFAVSVTDQHGVGQFVITIAGTRTPTRGHVATQTGR